MRKQFGHGYIPVGFYEDINGFTAGVLAEHLNFHRPCWFPQETTDSKGRILRQYRAEGLMTPYEKFRSLPDAASFLRPGVTLEQLELQARRLSDNDSAARLLRERKKLFKPILAHLAVRGLKRTAGAPGHGLDEWGISRKFQASARPAADGANSPVR